MEFIGILLTLHRARFLFVLLISALSAILAATGAWGTNWKSLVVTFGIFLFISLALQIFVFHILGIPVLMVEVY